MPANRTVRIGLHARNDFTFSEGDYLVIKEAGIETLKILSLTGDHVFERVRQENPGLEFIVRLYDRRVGASHPDPASFAAAAIPRINELRPFATKFEILNEPNHHQGYEGWGSLDDAARSFRDWYLQVFRLLKRACPWALFGFPGLAPHWPHRDLEWLDICREAVRVSDWLGCHIYWQGDNHLKNEWGLRFKLYHEKFPDKIIEITEFGNSTPNLSGDVQAAQYAMFYQELFNYPYLGSACSFIASSPDPQWTQFVWRKESGEFRPMVRVIGNIPRPPVVLPTVTAPMPAYRVEWLEYSGPDRWTVGERQTVRIKLKNSGTATWSADQVKISYQWYTLQGEPLRSAEDTRTRLPADMAPGMLLTLNQIPVCAPTVAGTLLIRWDLVEADTLWFSSRGSPVLEREARVEDLASTMGVYFAETQCSVAGPFLALYRGLGEAVCGLPITDAHLEGDIRVQYFQNVAMEELSPGQIVLKPVGKEAYEARSRILELEDRIKTLETQVADLQGQLAECNSSAHSARPTIVDLTDTLPKHKSKTYSVRNLREIRNLVIHHTAAAPTVGPEAIARYHVTKLDWPGIGYHFVIMADGAIYQTNHLEAVSYHARSANQTSVGIALAGNLMAVGPTDAQLASAGKLLAYLLTLLGLSRESIRAHKDFVPTACPGDQWDGGIKWHDKLMAEVEKAR